MHKKYSQAISGYLRLWDLCAYKNACKMLKKLTPGFISYQPLKLTKSITVQFQYKRRHPSNGTSGSEDRCESR